MALKSAYVVPSRGRPENIVRLAKAFKTTEARSDLWVIIDEDDWKRRDYERNANEYDYGYIVVENYTGGVVKSLNSGVEVLMDLTSYDEYAYFGFLGDDHLPKTTYWDYFLMLAIPFPRNGIAYGNDLFQGENLPTGCLMNREIVDRLGGMTPPGFKHLYIDNFWKDLGRDIGGLYYKHDVIIQHLHPITGKIEMDEGYARVNSMEMYKHDLAVYEAYKVSEDYRQLVATLMNP